MSGPKINTVHPLLANKMNQISRSRDTYSGTDAIKSKDRAEEYLPKLSGQDKGEYENYKKRAVFYGATPKTVSALTGAISRKPAEMKNTESLEDFLSDVTGTGISMEEFSKDIENEVMVSGRSIVCVDRLPEGNNKPYLVWYKNEDCINWKVEKYKDFDKRLVNIVFREVYFEANEDNPYLQEVKYKFREYRLEGDNVVVNIWSPKKSKTPFTLLEMANSKSDVEYEITENYTLTNKGKPLGFIPCVPIVSDGAYTDIPKPPLLDMVDINLAHYRNSADLEHGLHWTALPTPWFSGVQDRSLNITLGSGNAIVLPDEGKAGFLEFTGAGLSKISEAMDKKENLMAALGARMLANRMDQSTSAEVARINVSGEISSLAGIAKSISRGLTRVIRMVAIWEGKSNPQNMSIHLNEDYVDTKLAGGDITALVGAYQNGAMSLDSLLWNLAQGERLPLGRDIGEEVELIEAGKEDIMSDFNKDNTDNFEE